MGIWLGFRSLEWGVIDHSSIVRDPSPSKPLLVIVLIFLLAGISLPLSERLFPLRFPPQQPEEVMHFLTAQEVFKQAGLGDEEITSFLQQAGGRLAWGQALYPRFYEKDRGEPDQYNFLRIQSYPRLTLTLGNRTGGNVILPLQASPASFPDGSLVYVIGCPGFSSLDALAMLVLPPGGEPRLLERWPVTEWKCPLPAPVCDENRNCQ